MKKHFMFNIISQLSKNNLFLSVSIYLLMYAVISKNSFTRHFSEEHSYFDTWMTERLNIFILFGPPSVRLVVKR